MRDNRCKQARGESELAESNVDKAALFLVTARLWISVSLSWHCWRSQVVSVSSLGQQLASVSARFVMSMLSVRVRLQRLRFGQH